MEQLDNTEMAGTMAVSIAKNGFAMPYYANYTPHGIQKAHLHTLKPKAKTEDDKRRLIKILGVGEVSKAFGFVGIDKFSKKAKEAIEKAGGVITKKD